MKATFAQSSSHCEDEILAQTTGFKGKSAPDRIVTKPYKPHFMIISSLACPAECSYCFGPHHGPLMSSETMGATLDFIGRITEDTGQNKVKVTFHGGEPLMAGYQIWHQALEGLTLRFGNGKYEVGLQSNLWMLDKEFCVLFRKHQVEIGTSLDGPKEITDRQRGKNYFERTTQGIRLAHSYGLQVGCIATFTPSSISHWRRVFDFFLSERLGLSIHAAVPPLEMIGSPYSLSPSQYGKLLRETLDYYVEHRRETSISSLDQMCQAIGCGEGKVCTFKDCLGMFLAIDPSGEIYPCQRFCGRRDYCLGNVTDEPTLKELIESPVAQRMVIREQRVREVCRDCKHLNYCKGGCTYNAWAGGQEDRIKDPYCPAYYEIFEHITKRITDEMGSEDNIKAIADRPFTSRGNPLLKKGPLIELVRGGPHPSQIARTAKRIVAAYELARGPDIPTVSKRLIKMGIAQTQKSGEASLKALQQRLQPKKSILNNLYLHVTFRCQLDCTHCYARADAAGRQQPDMPTEAMKGLIREAKELNFRQVIITGGEPLVHCERERLLSALMTARSWTSPMNIVLRTNLAMPLEREILRKVAAAVDQVVVSVDGDERTHDERRGKGSYEAVVRNLAAYIEAADDIKGAGELSLATVMNSADIQGQPGNSVRELSQRLGVRRTRFRPLLPLGRAKDWDMPLTSEALGGYANPMELIENGFHPIRSCGLGQNLYVEPSGESFPCYAYHRPHSYLGNVIKQDLKAVLEAKEFRELSSHNVDTNAKCRTCEVRYLCGGACRAWGGEATQYNLDSPPPECGGLRSRALKLLEAAREYLAI